MHEQRPTIAVTGFGAVSPLGVGVRSYIAGLRAGRSGVRRLPPEMAGRERIRSSVAAGCPDFEPTRVLSEADCHRLPRLVPMALCAAREAMAMARGNSDLSLATAGLVLGTGAGGIDFTLDQAKLAFGSDRIIGSADGTRAGISIWTITNATHGNLSGELSIRLGLHGPSWCISTGCASSSDAIGMAMETLRSARPGAPEAMLVVGADAHIRWETLAGMELLKVISTRDYRELPETEAATASRPFDRARDGFVLGEGAWAVMLEREHTARERGARVLARALGYGATCDAFHRVRPSPDMHDTARAMRLALDDAALAPNDIDVLHYHGTGTRLNDALETTATRLIFEAHAPRLAGHSVKGAIGHPQGACGAAAVVASLGAMLGLDDGEPFLPPTVNLTEPDVEGGCDLDYTPRSSRPLGHRRRAMVNCLAFGAKNSALVFETV